MRRVDSVLSLSCSEVKMLKPHPLEQSKLGADSGVAREAHAPVVGCSSGPCGDEGLDLM